MCNKQINGQMCYVEHKYPNLKARNPDNRPALDPLEQQCVRQQDEEGLK